MIPLPSRGHETRSQRGSISVAATGLMVAIVILALMSSDLARVLAAASRAQTAADAAALAAAQELALPSGASPSGLAATFARRNGAVLVSCDCAAGRSEAVVEARLDVGRLLFFGGGHSVTAKARAVVNRGGGPGAGRGS
jgi:secretion/DNA translocation related TadE-like protein